MNLNKNVERGIFWNNKQKQSNPIHEVSYRASFKPELPAFFIENYTNIGDVVYDPFGGRGTTAIESSILHRNSIINDINPLLLYMAKGRIVPPHFQEVEERIANLPLEKEFVLTDWEKENLLPFFNIKTLFQILSLREYFFNKEMDNIDYFIISVALSRLTGHSKGFFSVYTLPPNQAVRPNRQLLINEKYSNDLEEVKSVKEILLKKSKSLLRERADYSDDTYCQFLNCDSRDTPDIKDSSVDLVVTSPPFVNVIDYVGDNWLRNWFIDELVTKEDIVQTPNIEEWNDFIKESLLELKRVVKKGGKIAIEVGEVMKGSVDLSKNIVDIGESIGLDLIKVFIQDISFTKTSAIWGIENNKKGTNTNRVVLFGVN